MSIEKIQDLKPKSRLRPSPLISAALVLIFSIAVVFLLLAGMEEAFSVVENFFEQTPNAIWLIQVPIPLTCTLVVYYVAQQSQKSNLNSLVFLSSALGTGIIGMCVYFILYTQSSILNHSQANFYYILVLSLISLLIGFIVLIILKFVRNKRTLHEGLIA